MESAIKILVVEDEMIIGAKIMMQLSSLGYEVTGIVPRGEEAIIHVTENKPDIVLLDINLKGQLDGIDTACKIQELPGNHTAIIYLTANSDDATFNRAKQTKPAAFISKPFKQLDLQRAIELTISRMGKTETTAAEQPDSHEQPGILSDRFFIRHKEKLVKLMVADILYMEADRNYCRIFTKQKEYMLSVPLKTIEEKITSKEFLRIHRSFLVNISHVDEVAESHIVIAQKAIPLGIGMKEQLMQRMQTL
jgi:DNA-binding LytR/AlgR family response regulator